MTVALVIATMGSIYMVVKWTKSPESWCGDTVVSHLNLKDSHLHLTPKFSFFAFFFCMGQCFSSAKSLSAITAREIVCRFGAEKIMEYVSLVSKSGIGHLSTMEGWHFPVTARLAAYIFLPRKLGVALRVQLCKRGVLSAFALATDGSNVFLPTDRWGPSRTTLMGFESLHW